MISSTEDTLTKIISVMSEYGGQRLTVRQIYYRLVADHGLENSQNSYKRIVRIMGEARLSGTIGFDAILDRTREVSEFDKFDYISVSDHLRDLYDYIKQWDRYYNVPLWHGQPNRVVVMVEKQALQGIFEAVCDPWQVDLMVCKGYPSLTQQYELSQRLSDRIEDDQELQIVYFGDFDPSGENIPEKMQERLTEDFNLRFESFNKVALTYDQVEEWNLPPAPAKVTDSRTKQFVDKYGVGMQVELDAIKPDALSKLIRQSIDVFFDGDIRKERDRLQSENRGRITDLIERMNPDMLLVDEDGGDSA